MPANYNKETLLQKIIASSPFLIYIYDLETKRSIFNNRKIEEVLGYTEADVIAMGSNIPKTILHQVDFAKLEDTYRQLYALKDDEEMVSMSRYRKKDGSYGWFKNTRTVFLRNSEGVVKQELGIVQEVTVEVDKENRLLDTENRFQAIFNSTSDFNFFVDKEFNILTLNHAAINYISKYTGSTIQPGGNLKSVMPPDMIADARAAMNQALAGETSDDIRQYNTVAGKKIWFRAKFFPVYNEATKLVTGVNINMRDVTNAFESRIALEQQNALLKEIARINSHEIRRPLSNILGLSELLSHYRDSLPDDVNSLLDLLNESSQELDTVIKKIVRTAASQPL